jgi:hypothetical protein
VLDHELGDQPLARHGGDARGAGFRSGLRAVTALVDDAVAVEPRDLARGARACRLDAGGRTEAIRCLQRGHRAIEHARRQREARNADALQRQGRAHDAPGLPFAAE